MDLFCGSVTSQSALTLKTLAAWITIPIIMRTALM
jgi:hypothetical protein